MLGGPRPRPRPARPEGKPSVFAADEQSDRPVDLAALTRLVDAVLREEGVRGNCELALRFVDETTIADLNERFLGGRGPTDVLAFPLDAGEVTEGGRSPDAGSTGPDRPDPDLAELPVLLGDVVVCPSVANRNAPDHAGTYEDELALLVVHGVLHVLGMDHADEAETAVMQARERELLARHGPGAADGQA